MFLRFWVQKLSFGLRCWQKVVTLLGVFEGHVTECMSFTIQNDTLAALPRHSVVQMLQMQILSRIPAESQRNLSGNNWMYFYWTTDWQGLVKFRNDAYGALWGALERSGALWDALGRSGMLSGALGRSGTHAIELVTKYMLSCMVPSCMQTVCIFIEQLTDRG